MNALAREWWQVLGRPGKAALVLLPAWLLASYTGVPGLLRVLVGLAASIAATWAILHVGARLLRPLIWRLRNRLLVAFLFIAAIPIGLVIAFFTIGSYILAGQVATYLVYARLESRLESMQNQAALIARTEGTGVTRPRTVVEDDYPGAQILVDPGGHEQGHGLMHQDGILKAWARSVRNGRMVTIIAPLSSTFVGSLDPELGAVSLLPPREGTFRLFEPPPAAELERASVGTVPPAVNFLDSEVRWGSKLHVSAWSAEASPSDGDLGVRTRYSAILNRLASPGVETAGSFIILLYVVAILILAAEIASLLVGISITRTMTVAVHDLYEGTQRIMHGDFSHRIPVTGSEQIADLSRSFNTMTENVERLLKVSKEKERMQAELEIARSVQQQLFPSSMPHVKTVELRAVCQPARQVSGDYYDYQLMGDGKLVFALGDVAGKGISAALLMASLQSTLRVQLREWQTNVSTERLVTGLNQHLFLNTAPEKYATFFLAIYDETTGMLEYTNAGHLPPLLIRAGTAARLDSNGMVVGAFRDSQYDSSRLQLQMDDLLVCYTDGVTELENEFGEQFGEERLSEVLLKHTGSNLAEVEAAILAATAQFSGSPDAQDDLTLLMVRKR